MEEEDKSKFVEFGNKFNERAVEFGSKFSERVKVTYEDLNFLKYFTDLDKEISNNEKEKAIAIIEAVSDIEDDEIKAEALEGYIDSTHRKEITEKIIYAVKYLSGAIAVIVIAALMNQKMGD